jgi:alkylation response protein AidB-like acyl-CoA dehydrogenase
MAQTANPDWVSRAEELARKVLAAHAGSVDAEGRWPSEGVAALGRAGLLGLAVPTPLGGAGEGARTFAAVTRTLAEACGSTAMIYVMHVCGTRVMAATEWPRRDEVLRGAAAGRHLCTLAFSEKGSRSHFWAPVSQAQAEGEIHRLSAQKSWVTSAGHADSYIVSTRSAGRSDPMASTLYFVPLDAPGLSCAGVWNGMGMRGNASAPMRLDHVPVPAAHRVSSEGEGFTTMLNVVLPWFQLGCAAVSLGLARAATEATRQHLLGSTFEHLGLTLATLMNLRARLAQMQVATDAQQAFLDRAAGLLEEPSDATLLAVLESKAAAGEAALQVTDLAMRTCGGAAFSRHLSVERNFRDARAIAVMAPTTDVLYDFIAKSLLGMPLF